VFKTQGNYFISDSDVVGLIILRLIFCRCTESAAQQYVVVNIITSRNLNEEVIWMRKLLIAGARRRPMKRRLLSVRWCVWTWHAADQLVSVQASKQASERLSERHVTSLTADRWPRHWH